MIFSKSVEGGLPSDKEPTTTATAPTIGGLKPGGAAAPASLPPGQWAVMSRPEFVQALARVALLGERQDSIRDGGVDLVSEIKIICKYKDRGVVINHKSSILIIMQLCRYCATWTASCLAPYSSSGRTSRGPEMCTRTTRPETW
jgi:hypothetical protein